MTLRFDTLTTTDVSAALRLSAQAGWSMRERDWERMVSAPWVDAIGARLDGDLVATATVVRYGTDLAWIGSLLVDESRRRRGFGTEVFDAAVDRADDAAVVGLDANDAGKPIYDEAGFVDVAPVEQWTGVPDADGDASAVSRTDDPAAVAAIDRAACDVDRGPFLDSLLADPDTTAYRGPEGYAVVTLTPEGPAVGPVVAPSDSVVSDLIAAVAADHERVPLTANVVTTADAPRPFRDAGLSSRRTLTRMVDRPGARPLMDPPIRAIAGFAYG